MTEKRKTSTERAMAEREAHPDRGWRIAQLAIDIYRKIPAEHLEDNVPEAWEVDNIQNETVFMGCLKRAELLYDTAVGVTGELHAAELFEEAKSYSIDEITRIFRRHKFRNFSEGKLRPWLVQVHKDAKRRWLVEKANERQFPTQEYESQEEKFDKMRFLQDLVELTDGSDDEEFKKRFPPKNSLLAALHQSTRLAGRFNMGDILEACRALSLYSELLTAERRKLINPPFPQFRQKYPRLIRDPKLILHYSEFLGLLPDSPWWVQGVQGDVVELRHDMVCPECKAECDRERDANARTKDEEVKLGKRELILRFCRIRVDCPQHGARDIPLPDIVKELK